ncbi:MAG: Hsp20/alpha crystallin family protein [Candidatus Bathyarchaeota archaeon]|nr:Hsp20/alpha crystallin family protein [Candidatus Bathyarchaeota archaeon]
MALGLFDELAREMWDLQRGSLAPLVSVSETENRVIVEVDLPLVKKKDIHLRLVEGGLEVEASLTKCVRFERWGTVQRSCEFRSFYRIVSLPSPVVAEGVTAVFNRGILRVELKKRREVEYQIPIT